MGTIELTESQKKTANTCHNMFVKWQKTQEGKSDKDKSVAHYVKACIEGYPKGTQLLPNILKIRLKGIENFAKLNAVKLEEKTLANAAKLIEDYKVKFNAAGKEEKEEA